MSDVGDGEHRICDARGMRGLALAFALVAAACSKSPGSGSGSAPMAPPGSVAAAPPAPADALGCQELISCITPCADDACQSACLERATPAAREQATAIASCVTASGCAVSDEACMRDHCTSALVACAGGAPATARNEGTVAAALPPIAGRWAMSTAAVSGAGWSYGATRRLYDLRP